MNLIWKTAEAEGEYWAFIDVEGLGGSCLRQFFPEEEGMMQHSYGRYFPQSKTKVIEPIGEPNNTM